MIFKGSDSKALTTTVDDMTSTRPYLLRAFYEWISDNEMTPYILVDAEASDVGVPHQHVVDGQIVLNVGASAVKDLNTDNERLRFNARFGGAPFEIIIPICSIKAIYAKENGKGMVFSDDDISPLSPDPTDDGPKDSKKPHLKLIK